MGSPNFRVGNYATGTLGVTLESGDLGDLRVGARTGARTGLRMVGLNSHHPRC